MLYKIATQNGKLWGSGSGEVVSFKEGYDNIETFNDIEAFDARLEQLRGA